MNIRISAVLVFLIISVLTFGQAGHYDIAAFVWPSYHPDDRAKIFWPDGIGEWQTVKSNTP